MRASSRLLISLGLAAAPVFASAQWQWIENDGRKVFSDRPPPISVPEKNIISQPGNRGTTTAQPTTTGIAAARPQSAPANPPVGGKAPHEMASKALDEARKKLETAEADKQKIVEASNAKARADNCARARQSKQTFDSGSRVTRMNAQGEREYLDDAAKTTELTHLQTVIASDCRP
jgi:Domain of unknown function (DUF4124)